MTRIPFPAAYPPTRPVPDASAVKKPADGDTNNARDSCESDIGSRVTRLEVGDYRVEHRVIVERKTAADFAASWGVLV